MHKDKLMLVDGNSLLYRAFYALPPLMNSKGIYTNGVYGFFTMLDRVVAEESPTHLLVAFDKSRETFRREIFADYKANRSAPPDELKPQFSLLRQVLEARNIDYLEVEGYEADDIIGTLSHKATEKGMETLIVTGDGDSLQLVSDQVQVLMTKKGISEIQKYDPAVVAEKWQVGPEKMVQIKALMGDSSDNIPGVPGVGAKTAIKLIKEFHDLETLYENLDQVKGAKLVEKLTANKELAFISRQLGTICINVPISGSIDQYFRKDADPEKLIPVYLELEFRNFLKALQEREEQVNPINVEDPLPEVIELTAGESLEELKQLAVREGLALLLESSLKHPMWADLEGMYLYAGNRVYHTGGEGKPAAEWLPFIRDLLETDSIPKIMHNAKFAEVLLRRYGIELRGLTGDTLLLTYVIDPAFNGEELGAAVLHFLNEGMSQNRGSQMVTKIPKLLKVLEEKCSPDLKDLYCQMELPLSHVLAGMEYTGIKVDGMILAEISESLTRRIEESAVSIHKLAGSEFNINSPQQLGKVLFEDLGLRTAKKTKTGYSTSAEVLEELYDDHPIIPYIINYRQLSKLKSTYSDALQNTIHPKSGRVHTIFKQAQTATGRLSSVEPNLQNIPIRMEEGRRIRRAFVARDEKHLILSADYSQIDLRSLAHISGDENLIETFNKGIDIHTRTAAEIFKVPLDQVDEDLRRRAKAVNFGIIYGISDFGLARDTGVSRKEAKMYIESYLASYPGVQAYMEAIVAFGKKYGYVETIFNRRRYLPDLNAKNKMVQSFARRMALNTPIQGTSADIIKLAMVKVFQELQERNLQSQLLLQVHDDLILEVPAEELEEVADLLKSCMENACQLKVPLEVSMKTGPNWYDMIPYII